VLAWLLSFLEQNPDSLDDTMAELLVYTTSKLSSEVRSKLFSLVYNTYFDRLVWLPTWASNDLSRFVGPNEYQHLKSHLKDWPGLTETYVKRGNVIAIVEGLLKDKSGLLTKAELSFWRKTLIQLASHPNDDGNGVIQRHSLGALAYYHDEEIIPLVAKACFDNTNDTLVQDQFMHFCTVTAPESLYTLQYLVKGIKGSSTIYGRYGLYNLKSKKPIKALVKALIDDGEMLKAFLDKESIFDKDSGDQKLYANIDTVIDQSIVSLLKQLVQKLFSSKELYPDNNSPLIRYLAKTILRHDPDYILELVQDIQNQENDDKVLSVFFDYDSFLGLLLTPDNLEKYLKSMDSLPTRVVERKDGPIYTALNANGKIGHDVYEKAIKLGIVQKREELKESPFDVKNRRDKYQEFRGLLEPAPGKYIPSVFQYYINNRETIEKAWSQSEKDRLLKLAIDEGIAKIDPRQIKVKFNDKETRNFTWTSVAAYYGDILQVIKALSPDDISKYRQNIINFIPYAFSDDMSLILELIPTAMDKELSDVNQILLDKKQDVRYLIPSSYIYTVGQYLKKGCIIPGVAKVLRSFIDDEEISIYDRVSALENYESFLISKDKTWLTKIHNNFLKDEAKRDLSYLANELLIRVYLDQKSIDWRFNEVRKPKPFEGYPPLVAHSVGPTEHEFHSMGFAKPLIELKDSKYLPLFIELLDYSFTIQSQHTDDKSYWEYTNYLWRIIIGYLENLSSKGSFRSLLSIEKWAKSHNQIESSNWFISRLHQLRKDYINYLGKVKI